MTDNSREWTDEFEKKLCNVYGQVEGSTPEGVLRIKNFISQVEQQAYQRGVTDTVEKIRDVDFIFSQTGIAIGTKKAIRNEILEIIKEKNENH